MSKKNLYEVIIEDLLADIRNNLFSFEKPICTEKSLTERYGVSRITAKRALTELERSGVLYRKRGNGSFVCRDILSRQAAGSGEAGVAREKPPKHVAFVLPFDITRGGAMEIVRSAGDLLGESGYYLSLHISDRNLKKEKTIIEDLYRQDISALIYYPTNNSFHVDELMLFALEDKPVVVIDLLHDCSFLYSIVSDNAMGQKALTQRLIELGHRRIAYAYNVALDRVPSVRDRLFGYCTALKENGIDTKMDYVIGRMPEDCGEIKAVVQNLVKQGVTAIETENDEVAFRVLQACKCLNVLVPEELCITGFDDSAIATAYGADLTTVRQDFRAMGELAAKIILSELAGRRDFAYRQVLPVQVVERTSTGPRG